MKWIKETQEVVDCVLKISHLRPNQKQISDDKMKMKSNGKRPFSPGNSPRWAKTTTCTSTKVSHVTSGMDTRYILASWKAGRQGTTRPDMQSRLACWDLRRDISWKLQFDLISELWRKDFLSGKWAGDGEKTVANVGRQRVFSERGVNKTNLPFANLGHEIWCYIIDPTLAGQKAPHCGTFSWNWFRQNHPG